ncbi:MAG: hypothetical protein KY476_24180, partial [Planctomycetes bacterium]|nr:hypothetical protein [Planctomycetota bacterium]
TPPIPPLVRGGAGKATEYIYFPQPYPLVRVAAQAENLPRLNRYEAFTCLVPGSTLGDPQIDRDADGRVRYGWKKNTPPVGPAEQAKLIERKLLAADEALLQLRDVHSGKAVRAHSGSVYWNEYRGRWVMIAVEVFGTSMLGEVWYAEADSPVGPWVYAAKIVTHEKYSFYNPKHHPFFDANGGRTIYFEGTYTHTFSGNDDATPRYDYNQMMYRLDLEDERLALPVAVYRSGDVPTADSLASRAAHGGPAAFDSLAFFAPDRPAPGTRPVRIVANDDSRQSALVLGDEREKAAAVFYALPPDVDDPPETTVPLYVFCDAAQDRFAYSTNRDCQHEGFERLEQPLCRVWTSPYARCARSDRLQAVDEPLEPHVTIDRLKPVTTSGAPVTALAVSTDGHTIVAGSQAGVELLGWPGLKTTRRLDVDLEHVHDLAFSPDGKRLAVAGGTPAQWGSVVMYAWPSLKRLYEQSVHDDVVYSVTWQSDSTGWASASHDGMVNLHRADNGKLIATLAGHSRGVRAVCFLDEGGVLVSAGLDHTLRVWNATSGERLRSLDHHTAAVHDLSVRPATAGSEHAGPPMVASVSDDRTIRLWQPTIGRMVRFVRLAEAVPLAVEWTADGLRLLVTADDGRLRLIDPDTAAVTGVLPALDGWAWSLAVHPDGEHALVGGPGGVVRRVRIVPAEE